MQYDFMWQAFLRWMHVMAGVAWIGHLYFFNFVNANFAKTMDGPTKKAVVPELMPRALWVFRWGAAWTWLTGFLLLGAVYYMGGGGVWLEEGASGGLGAAILVGSLVVVYLYDVVQKTLGKNQMVANVVSLALLVALYVVMRKVGHFTSRALYIHVGAILGTAMAFNVWMRIWPSQKKIIAAIRDGNAPDAAVVAMAGARSRQNTFLSAPLLFLMVSNHYPNLFGGYPTREATLAVVFVLGFAIVNWIYKSSAGTSPAQI